MGTANGILKEIRRKKASARANSQRRLSQFRKAVHKVTNRAKALINMVQTKDGEELIKLIEGILFKMPGGTGDGSELLASALKGYPDLLRKIWKAWQENSRSFVKLDPGAFNYA